MPRETTPLTGEFLYNKWVDYMVAQGVGCDKFSELENTDRQAWNWLAQYLEEDRNV